MVHQDPKLQVIPGLLTAACAGFIHVCTFFRYVFPRYFKRRLNLLLLGELSWRLFVSILLAICGAFEGTFGGTSRGHLGGKASENMNKQCITLKHITV